jgi:hypothetical protein
MCSPCCDARGVAVKRSEPQKHNRFLGRPPHPGPEDPLLEISGCTRDGVITTPLYYLCVVVVIVVVVVVVVVVTR